MTDPARPAPKFRRRAEARPDEVLDAALGLFSGQGYAGTTMDQIARAAGLSKGGVYLYFASKQEVLEGLVRRAIAPVAEAAASGLAGGMDDPPQAIRRALLTVTGTLGRAENLAVLKLVLREAVALPALAEMYRAAVLDRVLPVLTAAIRRGVETGQFRPVEPELTVRSVVGPIFLHLALAEFFHIRPAAGLELDRLAANHLDILMAGLAPAPTAEGSG